MPYKGTIDIGELKKNEKYKDKIANYENQGLIVEDEKVSFIMSHDPKKKRVEIMLIGGISMEAYSKTEQYKKWVKEQKKSNKK